ncbi:uncharacterized protein N7500_008973 [Penicillium coprophilum]|uniref:uncharacterized protein n=1 Tax=Penicillium coprophilum TaxID=36646 RepID=UPI00238E7E8C|nr:uncharacterized protein N7500_008973 [Penicillium coprophilum]KAJ5159322.1 hypothetical protein N7500_008973 [Penicillium coprophilum]
MASMSTQGYDERHFQCSYCQKTFRRLEHLQRHTRRHTNEKPFACRCGALFSRRDLLRRHERMVGHSNSDDVHPHTSNDSGLSKQSADNPLLAVPHNIILADTSIPEGQNNFPRMPNSPGLCTGVAEELFSSTDVGISFSGSLTTASQATQIVPHCANPTVTYSDRLRLLRSLHRVRKLFPGHDLPSISALTRYMAGYFTGFYPHAPFTHGPTFKLESCSPELCLAMMALGAIDRFEYTSATELFCLSKALLFDSQQCRARLQMRRVIDISDQDHTSRKQPMDEVRCLLCLAQFASWQSDPSVREEAYILQSLLAQGLRSSGLAETTESLPLHWEQWAQRESERRTKLFAFCFLGVQNIAYDVPPSIWCDEINLRLPCSCPEWTAPDETTWNLVRANVPSQQGRLNDTLETLLSSHPVDHQSAPPSPVGNYVVMHGLLHKILWSRRSMSGNLSRTFSTDFQSVLGSALQKWTLSWQQTPESNLEPLDPNGPLPFTSSALLSLAYIRKCFDVFPTRRIYTWAPVEIAQVLQESLPVDRTQDTLLAAYHATNLLSTLVNLGVQYFKNNQAILWSIEGTLCGLDCSIFLEKWLRKTQNTIQNKPLTVT